MAQPDEVDHGWMHGKVFRLKADCDRAAEFTGRWKDGAPEMKATPYKAGDLVKVVMVSRLGDCGITKDLEKEHGYAARVMPEELEEFKRPMQTCPECGRLVPANWAVPFCSTGEDKAKANCHSCLDRKIGPRGEPLLP
jgi:hypothetical protein